MDVKYEEYVNQNSEILKQHIQVQRIVKAKKHFKYSVKNQFLNLKEVKPPEIKTPVLKSKRKNHILGKPIIKINPHVLQSNIHKNSCNPSVLF